MPTLITDHYKTSDSKKVQDFIEQPNIVPVDYKTAIVDNRVDRLDTLLQYVDGSSISVIYFRQRLGRDDSVTDFSVDLSAPHQQYERIDGFEIIMQGGLNVSNNNSGGRTTNITGVAIVRQPIIPNVSDLILMDFGRGSIGLFKVTSSRRMSHRNNTLYEIEFSLVFEVTDQDNDKRIINLNSKVVEVFKYSIDYLKAGQNPLLTPKKAYRLEELIHHHNRLRKRWFGKYYYRYLETCLLPNQRLTTYDGYYMKAILKWFSIRDVPEMMYFKVFDDSIMPTANTPSIWDAITNQDKYILKDVFKKAYAIDVNFFNKFQEINILKSNGFKLIISPPLKDSDGVVCNNFISKSIKLNTTEGNKYYTYNNIPLINQVIPSCSYVFSNDFYNGYIDGQSHLEIQLGKYLENKITDIDVIIKLIEDVDNWGELEQYYYIPTLMVLINYTSRRDNV